jgi:hypothetical protein
MARRKHGPALDRCEHNRSGKGFRRLKAWKQLPILKAALIAIQDCHALEHNREAA